MSVKKGEKNAKNEPQMDADLRLFYVTDGPSTPLVGDVDRAFGRKVRIAKATRRAGGGG